MRAFILAFISLTALAAEDPPVRHPPCLDLAIEMQELAHTNRGVYIMRDDEFHSLMPDDCKAASLEIEPRGTDGFHMLVESNRQVWLFDDNKKPVRLMGKSLTEAKKFGFKEMAVKEEAPRPAADPKTFRPSRDAIEKIMTILPKFHDKEPVLTVEQLETCLTRTKSKTRECVKIFDDLDQWCSPESVNDLCMMYNKAVDAVRLPYCANISYGLCARKVSRLQKKCAVLSVDSDCLGFKGFLLAYVPRPEEDNPVEKDQAVAKTEPVGKKAAAPKAGVATSSAQTGSATLSARLPAAQEKPGKCEEENKRLKEQLLNMTNENILLKEKADAMKVKSEP